jgi:hypothetical protein
MKTGSYSIRIQIPLCTYVGNRVAWANWSPNVDLSSWCIKLQAHWIQSVVGRNTCGRNTSRRGIENRTAGIEFERRTAGIQRRTGCVERIKKSAFADATIATASFLTVAAVGSHSVAVETTVETTSTRSIVARVLIIPSGGITSVVIITVSVVIIPVVLTRVGGKRAAITAAIGIPVVGIPVVGIPVAGIPFAI